MLRFNVGAALEEVDEYPHLEESDADEDHDIHRLGGDLEVVSIDSGNEEDVACVRLNSSAVDAPFSDFPDYPAMSESSGDEDENAEVAQEIDIDLDTVNNGVAICIDTDDDAQEEFQCEVDLDQEIEVPPTEGLREVPPTMVAPTYDTPTKVAQPARLQPDLVKVVVPSTEFVPEFLQKTLASHAEAVRTPIKASRQHRRCRGKKRGASAEELVRRSEALPGGPAQVAAPVQRKGKPTKSRKTGGASDQIGGEKSGSRKTCETSNKTGGEQQRFRVTCVQERSIMIHRVVVSSVGKKPVAMICNQENHFESAEAASNFTSWCLLMAMAGATKPELLAAKNSLLQSGVAKIGEFTFAL